MSCMHIPKHKELHTMEQRRGRYPSIRYLGILFAVLFLIGFSLGYRTGKAEAVKDYETRIEILEFMNLMSETP